MTIIDPKFQISAKQAVSTAGSTSPFADVNSTTQTSAKSTAEDSSVQANLEGDADVTIEIAQEDAQAVAQEEARVAQAEAQMQDAFDEVIQNQELLSQLNQETSQLMSQISQAPDTKAKDKLNKQFQGLIAEKSTVLSALSSATVNYRSAQALRASAVESYNSAVDLANLNMQAKYQQMLESGLNDGFEYQESSSPQSPTAGSVNVLSADASQYAQGLIGTASKEIGVKETRSDDSERISQYRGYSAANPWCASFVSWCMQQTFGQYNPLKHTESVSNIMSQAQNAGVYGARGSYTPKAGDIIIFKGGSMSHTGIVEKVENGKVHIVDGNSSNQVKRNTYSLSDTRINGYAKTDEWVNQKK